MKKIYKLGLSCVTILLILACTSTKQVDNTDINKGLIGHYSFDGNANDNSIKQNHGTIHGVVQTSDRKGKKNSAYSFNGKDNYIETKYALQDMKSLTICLWVSIDTLNTNIVVFYHEGDNTGNKDLQFYHKSGKLFFKTKDDDILITDNSSIEYNKWLHIVTVADAENNKKQIWINGEKVKENLNWTGVANINNHYKFQIGQFADGTTNKWGMRNFLGIMDDFRIYNYALTKDEIKRLYISK